MESAAGVQGFGAGTDRREGVSGTVELGSFASRGMWLAVVQSSLRSCRWPASRTSGAVTPVIPPSMQTAAMTLALSAAISSDGT